jgi:hypothetical protein
MPPKLPFKKHLFDHRRYKKVPWVILLGLHMAFSKTTAKMAPKSIKNAVHKIYFYRDH